MIRCIWSRIVAFLLDGCGVIRPIHDYRQVGCEELGESNRYRFRYRCFRCGKEKTWRSR